MTAPTLSYAPSWGLPQPAHYAATIQGAATGAAATLTPAMNSDIVAQKVSTLETKVAVLEEQRGALATREDLQKAVVEITGMLHEMALSLKGVEGRMGKLDTRVDGMDKHLASKHWVTGAFLSALGAVLVSFVGIALQLYLHAH